MRWRSILLAAVLLAGCESRGTVERDRLSELAVGRTTSAGLTRSWGPAVFDSTLPDGRHVLTYRYIHMQTGPITTMVPGFGPMGSSTDTTTGRVTLTFDLQGVLMDVSETR